MSLLQVNQIDKVGGETPISVSNIIDTYKLRSTIERLALESGYILVTGSFEEGASVSLKTQVVWQQATGKIFGWFQDGVKTVVPGSTPETTGGISGTGWVDKTGSTLRSDVNIVIKVFTTVSDMVSDTTLVVGQKCRTLGYHTAGDGGGNDYVIVSTGGSADGGSIIDIVNGFQAKGLVGSVISVHKFGAKGDGVTDDTAAIQAALDTGAEVVCNSSYTYAVSDKATIRTDGQIFDGRGCTFLWLGIDQVDKYDSPIAISGGGETETFSTVTSNIGSYITDIPVSDASVFSKGDFAVFKYSIRQGDGVTQPPIACNPFGGAEYIVRIVGIAGNVISIDRPRAFPMFSSPPAGGTLQLIKVNVVKGSHIRNYTFKQQTPSTLVWNSAASISFAANCSVENVNCIGISGLGVICEFAHTLTISRGCFLDATFFGSGQGYGVQLATGCSFVNISGVYASGLRHGIDISGCSAYVFITTTILDRLTNGAMGSHGGFEHDIVYDGNKCLNSAIGLYLGTSGDAFGNKSKNISILNHMSQFCDTGIYGGLGTTTRPENVSIINYTSHRDTSGGSTSYDIRLQADNVSIADSNINGGVWLEDSYASTVTDVIISNTTLSPFATSAISNSVAGAKVILDNCVVKGNLDIRSGSDLILDGCIIKTSGLFVERTGEIVNSIAINGCTLDITGSFTNTVRVNDWLFTNNTSVTNGFNARFYLDGTTNPISRVVVESNKGDICHTLRRVLKATVTNNQQLAGADEFFSIVQSNNSRVVVANNTLQKSSLNAYCVDFGDFSSPDFNDSNWVVMGNLHNGTLRLTSATGTISKLAAIGNIYNQDVGDTATQSSVTPAPSSNIVVANNVGW